MESRKKVSNSELESDVRSDACVSGSPPPKDSWPLSQEYSTYFKTGDESVLPSKTGVSSYATTSGDSGFGSGCSNYEELQEQMTAMCIRDSLKPESEPVIFDSGIDSGNLSGINDELSKLNLDAVKVKQLSLPETEELSTSSSFSSLVSESSMKTQDEGFSDSQCIQLTTQQRIDLYKPDVEGDTQLHIAVIQCMGDELLYDTVVQIIRLALCASYLDIQNVLLQTPLILAALTKQADIVRQLVLAGASINLTDRYGNTALSIAVQNGDIETIRALATPLVGQSEDEAGNISAIINKKNYEGLAPVHLAVLNGHMDLLNYLYKCGADINIKCDKTGETILHILVQRHSVEVLQIVAIKFPLDVEAVTFSNMTALNLAVELRRNDMVEFLVHSMSADRSELEFYPVEDSEEEEMEDDFIINGQPVLTS